MMKILQWFKKAQGGVEEDKKDGLTYWAVRITRLDQEIDMLQRQRKTIIDHARANGYTWDSEKWEFARNPPYPLHPPGDANDN